MFSSTYFNKCVFNYAFEVDGMIFNLEKKIGTKAGKIDYNMVTTKNSTILLMPYIDFICFFGKKWKWTNGNEVKIVRIKSLL